MVASGALVDSAPDGGWGWMIVLSSFMIHVIADGITYSFGILAIEFIEVFDATREQIGWIGSIMVGITLALGPISGMLCNRFGYRSVTIAGAIIAAVGFGLTYFATSMWVIFITIGVLTGIGFGLIYLPAIVTVGLYFEKRRSFAMGLAVCGSGVGTFAFAKIIEHLLIRYSWQGSVLVLSGIILNCIICGALFRPLNLRKPNVANEDETLLEKKSNQTINQNNIQNYIKSVQDISEKHDAVAVSFINTAPSHMSHPQLFIASITSIHELPGASNYESSASSKWKSNLQNVFAFDLMKNPIFVLFLISNFLTSIGFNAPFMYLPDRGEQEGFSSHEAAMLISALGIANTVGRIVFGFIANLKWINRLQLYNVSLFLCGLATILSFLCKTYPLLITYSAVFGLLIGVYVTLTSVVLVDLLGVEQLNNSFGITILFQGLAVLIGPPLAGFIFDQTRSYDPSFWVCGAMIGVSGLILFPVPCFRTFLLDRNYSV